MPELTPPSAADARRVRVLVSGDVQGVGFRWSARAEAVERGLAGWVRNRPDGRVEAVFEGPPEEVDAMVSWCRIGPRWATVQEVSVVEEAPGGESGFQIVR
ncbi:MAG TPA: acylphosphatase [Actinomycetota bacterium]|nr:acylphosphatase [Actinomycetota bacterium]